MYIIQNGPIITYEVHKTWWSGIIQKVWWEGPRMFLISTMLLFWYAIIFHSVIRPVLRCKENKCTGSLLTIFYNSEYKMSEHEEKKAIIHKKIKFNVPD